MICVAARADIHHLICEWSFRPKAEDEVGVSTSWNRLTEVISFFSWLSFSETAIERPSPDEKDDSIDKGAEKPEHGDHCNSVLSITRQV